MAASPPTRHSTFAGRRSRTGRPAAIDRVESRRHLFTAEHYDRSHAALAVLLGSTGSTSRRRAPRTAEDLGFERGHPHAADRRQGQQARRHPAGATHRTNNDADLRSCDDGSQSRRVTWHAASTGCLRFACVASGRGRNGPPVRGAPRGPRRADARRLPGHPDDEGEDLDDARDARSTSTFGSILRPHSFVAIDNDVPVAFAFVIVGDVHYIDPVVVASARKRYGLGGAVVRVCLRSSSHAGVSEVGATITDGNMASTASLRSACPGMVHGPELGSCSLALTPRHRRCPHRADGCATY